MTVVLEVLWILGSASDQARDHSQENKASLANDYQLAKGQLRLSLFDLWEEPFWNLCELVTAFVNELKLVDGLVTLMELTLLGEYEPYAQTKQNKLDHKEATNHARQWADAKVIPFAASIDKHDQKESAHNESK